MSRSAARSAPSAQVPRISPRSRLMFFARPSDQRGSRKRVSPGANRNARPGSASTPPSSSACAYACVCCAPTLGRQLAMSIVVTPLIDGAWRPLARQLARSHQEFVDRARALAPFADRPHDERLAAAHVAGGEHAIDAGAVVVGAGPRIAARVARDAERIEYAGARACEAHRQQHELGLDRELRARYFGHSHLSVRIPRPVDARADEPLDAAVAALEALRGHRPVALTSFFLRRRRAQLDRPVGPRQRLVFVLGRLRQQLELHDRQRALAVGRADAVGPGVATADDDHMLACRGRLRLHAIAGDDTVLLRQEIHREMNARELAALHAQVARLLGAAGQRNGCLLYTSDAADDLLCV